MDTDDLDPDPDLQFDLWLAEAIAAGISQPDRMALATATLSAVPSVRMVLLKGHDRRGFVLYTNRESRKAAELAENPRAALALHWESLNRQVRVEGTVEPLGDEESYAYFATRARGSRLAAWASPQSREIEGAELQRRLEEVEARFAGIDDVPLPPFWGGYRVVPEAIEFWQGQPNRFHDRVRYERAGAGWQRHRLGP